MRIFRWVDFVDRSRNERQKHCSKEIKKHRGGQSQLKVLSLFQSAPFHRDVQVDSFGNGFLRGRTQAFALRSKTNARFVPDRNPTSRKLLANGLLSLRV